MGANRQPSAIRALRDQARVRPLIDFQATARARARRQQALLYADWKNVGAAGAPAFQNGWGNYNPVVDNRPGGEPHPGVPRNPCGFFRDRFGFVHLRGVISHVTINNQTIFTLPVELRPAGTAAFVSHYKTFLPSISALIVMACSITAEANGNVRVFETFPDPTLQGIVWTTLDDFRFRAANAGVI